MKRFKMEGKYEDKNLNLANGGGLCWVKWLNNKV